VSDILNQLEDSRELASQHAFTIRELAGEVRRLRSALTRVQDNPSDAKRIAGEALR
jgi:hypothetical protein